MKENSQKPAQKNNFFTKYSNESPSENNLSSNNKHQNTDFKINRLNDYDSTILENAAYQEIPDEIFKLEHKINSLEESLSKINNEINTLDSLEYGIQLFDLKNRKEKIEQELITLNKQYSELNLSARLSNQIMSAVNFASNQKQNKFSKFKKFVSKKILAKISKKIDYYQTMKEAVDNLNNININVDQLVQMQTPYGETINRYEKLTAYLNKANLIHSKISSRIDELLKK